MILFDEIEKAHHEVFNVLLQVLDDGRLTDGQGPTVDFKNTIVIMTSNLGSPIIQEYLETSRRGNEADSRRSRSGPPSHGGGYEAMEDKVRAELKKHFRPEFLNRVDDTIIFQSLDESELARSVERDLRVEAVLEKVASATPVVSAVDAEIYYRLHPEAFDRPEARRLRHILITFNTAAKAMHSYSARMPEVEVAAAPAPWGTSTELALQAGIHHGILGELHGLSGAPHTIPPTAPLCSPAEKRFRSAAHAKAASLRTRS